MFFIENHKVTVILRFRLSRKSAKDILSSLHVHLDGELLHEQIINQYRKRARFPLGNSTRVLGPQWRVDTIGYIDQTKHSSAQIQQVVVRL